MKGTGKWRLEEQPWLSYSAINPNFARKLELGEQMKNAEHDPYFMMEQLTSMQTAVKNDRTRYQHRRQQVG